MVCARVHGASRDFVVERAKFCRVCRSYRCVNHTSSLLDALMPETYVFQANTGGAGLEFESNVNTTFFTINDPQITGRVFVETPHTITATTVQVLPIQDKSYELIRARKHFTLVFDAAERCVQ